MPTRSTTLRPALLTSDFNWAGVGRSGIGDQLTVLIVQVAIHYPTRAALGDALRRLVAAGWPLSWVNDHGTHEALYLDDPDGNGLELAWDRPESEWPRDAEGHLTFANRRLDLEGLLAEGA